jgi:hypothetical protein
MLDVEQLAQKDRPSSFAQWAYDAIGQPGVCLRVRLRGNNLHILCESRQSLEAQSIVNCLIDALKVQEGEEAFPTDPGNPVDQLVIYGRIVGQPRPEWIKQIRIKSYPNPEHQASRTATGNYFEDATPDEALLISNESLARSGSPEAIARYLSETLSPLGVSAKVLIQILPETPANVQEGEKLTNSSPHRRLWIVCNSNYSPDASLLCEPVVEQLRTLQLKGFRDAAICSQVSGETSPEWMLRVDLTPPEEMLKEWARWGDVQAITRILNQRLKRAGIEVRAVLKDVTLHLFCNVLGARQTGAPDKQTAVKAIASGLESISPQGIQAATVYGVEAHQRPRRELIPEQETPIWIEWINLPAADTPALAETAFSLAKQGNQEAIAFLLQRLLNPDLDRRLATGGIHLKIRRKQDLLHIMSEAPLCPPQAQVGPPIARLLRQMGIPEIAGVRIYGRRAGATSPSWNYGVNFIHRPRLVPEATPEFAASDTYINELMAPTGEPVLRRDLTKEDLKNGLKHTTQAIVRMLQLGLCYSQLFVPAVESQDLRTVTGHSNPKSFSSTAGVKVAIVWGALGLLLTVQADWLIGRWVQLQAQSNSVLPTATTTDASPKPLSLPQLTLQKSGSRRTDQFNASAFTRQGEKSVIINENADKSSTPKRVNAATAAVLAAARSSNPSFNNQLLDQKLALYQQRLLKSGPPDVLILGSSRALRGIDPVALQDALAAQGYRNVEVFNFGINGATAQVVDLLIRRVLAPEQLPKLIIWADGARAFNSGRVDATYEAITSSKAYQQIQAGTFSNSVNVKQRDGNRRSGEASQATRLADETPQPLAAVNTAYRSIGQWIDRSLSNVSSTYRQRDQLKSLLQEEYVTFLERTQLPQDPTLIDSLKSSTGQESIDIDGFLPLTVRFNPASYYKQHPRVAGDYDNDYESFQLDGKQDIALGSLLQYAQSQNMGIVFINLPLTKDYLDPVRTRYEQQFQRYMRSWALQKGLLFRDLSQLLPTKHDYFSDPSHLNRYGAYKVSNQLAQDPMIPWPTK